MNFSTLRLLLPCVALAAALALADTASAAPPPGMRWGDHSGLSPSTGSSWRGSAPRSFGYGSGGTTYYSRPMTYYSQPAAPGAAWHSYPPYYYPAPAGPVYAAPRVVYPPILLSR